MKYRSTPRRLVVLPLILFLVRCEPVGESVREPVRESGPETEVRTARILFVGDTSFGENYQQRRKSSGRVNVLESRGYDYPLAKLKPLLLRADVVVANLETPITDLEVSPLSERKSYVHHSDVEKAPAAFERHNMRVFSIANNHTMDYGAPGLKQTQQVLEAAGMEHFGAGRSESVARTPWRRQVTVGQREISLVVIGAFSLNTRYDLEYDFYAKENKPGVLALTEAKMASVIRKVKESTPRSFVVVFPHWGDNYRWRSSAQEQLAHRMVDAGADLVLGHGGHMLQEVELYRERWIVYGLGNFMFLSNGRYRRFNVPRFSLAAELALEESNGKVHGLLRFYPIVTDNLVTNFQPRLVTSEELDEVERVLKERSATSFATRVTRRRDSVGGSLELTLPRPPGE